MTPPQNQRTPSLLVVLYFAATFATASFVGGLTYSFWFLGVLAVFSLPGLPWVYAWGRPSLHNPIPLLIGCTMGIAISSLLNGVLVYFYGWTTWPVAVAIFLTTFIGLYFARFHRLAVSCPSIPALLDRGDYLFLVVVGILLLVILAVPLSRVGHTAGNAHLYHSLFSHDYLARYAYTAGVLRGLPANCIFLENHKLPLYYLYYALEAFSLHSVGAIWPDVGDSSFPTHPMMAASNIYLSMFFVFLLFLCIKYILPSRASCYLALTCVLFAYSYKGMIAIVRLWGNVFLPAGFYDYLHKHGVLQFSDASHGWYRDFMVEPQAVMAMIFFLIAFLVVCFSPAQRSPRIRAMGTALCLFGAYASDAGVGIIAATWYVALACWEWFFAPLPERNKTRWQFIRTTICMVAVFSVGWSITLASRLWGTSQFSIGPSLPFLQILPIFFPIEYGGMFFLAAGGLWCACTHRREPFTALPRIRELLILAIVCLFFMAFVSNTRPQFADWVIRRSTKIFYFVLTAFSGYGIYALMHIPKGKFKLCLGSAAIFLGILATVSTITDFASFSGLYDDRTSKISSSDYEACVWLRLNTPTQATVQSLPEYNDAYYEISPVAMIGGRAMALGNLKIANSCDMSPAAFLQVKNDVLSLFEDIDCSQAINILKKYSIDYLYIGEHERMSRPDCLNKYYTHSEFFQKVYSQNGVDIFHFDHK